MKLIFGYLVSTLIALSGCSKAEKNQGNDNGPAAGDLRYAVFGDSLAAGLFADTQVGDTLSENQVRPFAQIVEAYLKNQKVPDSYFKNLDSALAAPDLTAFGGSADYALPELTKKKTGKNVWRRLYAVSAATAETLQPQVVTMQQDLQRGFGPFDVIVMHVGGNDWCGKIPVQDFEKNYTQRFKDIAQQNPHAHIVLLPIPDLTIILSSPDQTAFQLNSPTGKQLFTCQKVRETTKTCSTRNIAAGASRESLAADIADVQAYNQTINRIAANAKTIAPAFSGNIAVGNAYGEAFATDWLAVDCFHPGEKGQQEIAKLAWPALDSLLP